MIDDYIIYVRRQPSDYKIASYNLKEFDNPHWDNISGGIHVRSNQFFIYGYVNCQHAIEGEVSHSGLHGECPHNIKVCALKKDNSNKVFKILLEEAGVKPNTPFATTRAKPITNNSCKIDVIEIITREKRISGKALYLELTELGHKHNNFVQVIRKLVNEKKIIRLGPDENDKRYSIYEI